MSLRLSKEKFMSLRQASQDSPKTKKCTFDEAVCNYKTCCTDGAYKSNPKECRKAAPIVKRSRPDPPARCNANAPPANASPANAPSPPKDEKQAAPLFSRAESLFLYALDNVNSENHKCLALRDNLAVCGPAPDNFMNDVLIEREKVETVMNGVECFTVAQAEGGEMMEVCAPSRMEAHLQMQAIGLQFAEIGAKMR